jgi:hypothetical protein
LQSDYDRKRFAGLVLCTIFPAGASSGDREQGGLAGRKVPGSKLLPWTFTASPGYIDGA